MKRAIRALRAWRQDWRAQIEVIRLKKAEKRLDRHIRATLDIVDQMGQERINRAIRDRW